MFKKIMTPERNAKEGKLDTWRPRLYKASDLININKIRLGILAKKSI